MAKKQSSEEDRYLLYWISAGSEGKRILFNKKFNHTYKNICNDFFFVISKNCSCETASQQKFID